MPMLTIKGQVTIPKAIRDKLGIHPGESVEFVEIGGRVEVRASRRATPYELGAQLFGRHGSGRGDLSVERKRIAREAAGAKHRSRR